MGCILISEKLSGPAWVEIAYVISIRKKAATKSGKMAEAVKSGSFLAFIKVIALHP